MPLDTFESTITWVNQELNFVYISTPFIFQRTVLQNILELFALFLQVTVPF